MFARSSRTPSHIRRSYYQQHFQLFLRFSKVFHFTPLLQLQTLTSVSPYVFLFRTPRFTFQRPPRFVTRYLYSQRPADNHAYTRRLAASYWCNRYLAAHLLYIRRPAAPTSLWRPSNPGYILPYVFSSVLLESPPLVFFHLPVSVSCTTLSRPVPTSAFLCDTYCLDRSQA